MSHLPIMLGVTRSKAGNSQSGVLHARPVDEAAAKSGILKRDKHTCRFCGFSAPKYQQLAFRNGDRRDWQPDNVVTACIFCAQCLEIERVAAMRSGVLVWLPEFGQAALHHICRAIYVARISPGPMADAARSALDAFLARREDAKQRIGTDDPATLAAALQDYLEDEDYARRKQALKGIRLLPLDRRIVKESDIEFNQFPQIVAHWRSKDGPFRNDLPAVWAKSFAEIGSAA